MEGRHIGNLPVMPMYSSWISGCVLYRIVEHVCSHLKKMFATQLVQGQLVLYSGYLNTDGGKMTATAKCKTQ